MGDASAVKIVLPNFEGPFDLLFHLIEKEEVNIYDIPIAKITEQYIAYLDEMLIMDLELASEFLVMAATLLSIKARMLLPKKQRQSEEIIEDPRTELVEKLLEYKRFKAASSFLREKAGQASLAVARPDESEYYLSLFGDPDLIGVSLNDIGDAFAKILVRIGKEEPVVLLHKREITVPEKIRSIMKMLFHDKPLLFEELFTGQVTRTEVVITFLAVLELIRMRKVFVRQKTQFGQIMLFVRDREGES